MKSYLGQPQPGNGWGLVFIVTGAVELGLAATVLGFDARRPKDWVLVARGSTAFAGGLATCLAPEDDSETVLRATSFAVMGTFFAESGFDEPRGSSTTTFHPLRAAAGLGLLSTSALTLSSLVLRRPIG